MIKFAKIVDEETKLCEVGTGINTKFYKSIGMTEMDVEQAYNGQWYVKGFAPVEPETEIQYRVREIRNNMLEHADKYMIVDFPISYEAREIMKEYRQYLRDYTKQKDWWESLPMNFDEYVAHKEKPETEESEPEK